MASYFELHGRLRTITMEAWERLASGHDTFNERMSFWMKYFHDVVPQNVAPCHVPANVQIHNLNPAGYPYSPRMEIQLRCREGILMTGLVSMDRHNIHIEELTALVANEHWLDRNLVDHNRQAWAMFTCLRSIRFHTSLNGTDYRNVNTIHPIDNVREVVRYIRHQYYDIRYH